MLEIKEAKYVNDFKIQLRFSNGEARLVDLSDSLKGKVFEPLRDKNYFQKFHIQFNTIEWENGADFAPEYLFEISTLVKE